MTNTDPRKKPGFSDFSGITLLTVARNRKNQIRVDTWGGEGFRVKDDGAPEQAHLSSGTMTLSFELDAVATDAEAILHRWKDDNTLISIETHPTGDVVMLAQETGEKVAAGPSYG